MQIRPAEPRDILGLGELFFRLTEYIDVYGQDMFAKDPAKFQNGAVGFLIGIMHHEDYLVLVAEDKDKKLVGFLIGRMAGFFPFFEHEIVGEILWHYPLDLNTRPMARRFERWAKEKGATATANYHRPGNDMAAKAFAHHGLRVVWHYYFKPLEDT